MADVFVSYSRRDQAFVRRLHEALVAVGRETWVDWEGIPPSAKWMDEVKAAIDAANAFVFVVSPDSAASPVCREEADHAVAVGKRILPVVWRDTPEHDLPEAISAHNWLTLRATDDFDAGFARLLTALDTDLEWVKEHTRLVTRARDWEASGGERSRLLRGRDLGRAEQAIAQANRNPRPTAQQTSYVLASRQAERRGARLRTALLSGGLVVALVLAGFALLQRNSAEQNATLADQQRQVADDQRAEAEAQRGEAERQGEEAELRRVEALGRQLVAQSLASRSDLTTSLLLALEGLDRYESEEAWENLSELLQYSPQTIARYGLEELGIPDDGHGVDTVANLAASPDGSRLAAILSRCQDDQCVTITAELWILDTATWRPTHGPVPVALHESPWGVAAEDRLAFAPDGTRVVFPSADGLSVIRLADASVHQIPKAIGAHGDIAWASGGNVVRWFERDDPNGVRLWTWDPVTDATSSMELHPSHQEPGELTPRWPIMSRDGRWAVVIDQLPDPDVEAYTAELFDTSTGEGLGSIPSNVTGFSSAGPFLIASDREDGLRVHDLPGLEPLGARLRVEAVWSDVVAAGTVLLARESNGTIAAFDVATGDNTIPGKPSGSYLDPIAAGPEQLLYGASGGWIDVIDMGRQRGLSTSVEPVPEDVAGSAFDVLSGDGTRVASWGGSPFQPDRTVTVSDLGSGTRIAEVRPNDPSAIRDARLDEDGSVLYSLQDSGVVIRTSLDDGASTTLASFDLSDREQPASLVVSPDEDYVAMVGVDRMQVLDPMGRINTFPVGSEDPVTLASDGRSVILTSCPTSRVRVVSLVDGAVMSDRPVKDCFRVLDVAQGGSRALAASNAPDGTSQLRVYDPVTWERRGTLLTGSDVSTAGFEAATNDAMVVSVGTAVHHWDVAPEAWRAQACRIAGRNLATFEWERYLGDEPYGATCPDLPAAGPVAGPSPTPGPTPSATASAPPTPSGPALCDNRATFCFLPFPGHYSGDPFTPAVGFDLGAGWYQGSVLPSVLPLIRGDSQYLSIIRDVREAYDDEGRLLPINGTPDAFVEWLRGRRGVEVQAVRPATLAGRAATEIDLAIPTGATMFRPPNGGPWIADAGARWRIRIAALDADTTLLVVAESPAETFDEFWAAAAGSVVDSIVLE